METGEALDREVIVERAEALRGWLAGFPLSGRATSAIDRELNGIIHNDPGSYINGQRPLAGVTIEEFVAQLHSRNAGMVGKVKSVGDAVITELRSNIPADVLVAVAPEAAPEPVAEAAPEPVAEVAPEPVAEAAPEPAAEEPAAEAAPARRRGRPKGSTNAARRAAEAAAAAPAASDVAPADDEAPKPARRGRPKRVAVPGAVAPQVAHAGNGLAGPGLGAAAALLSGVALERRAAPAAGPDEPDPALSQLIKLWPSLHPHARRAIVLYASSLMAEAGFGD